MKHFITFIFILFAYLLPGNAFAQTQHAQKYQGLLWEISGNGLKKPSYLFGTMHVSSKMVFHLADSFYYALQNVNAVAIELNPEVWQVEMVKLDVLQKNFKNFSQVSANDYLNEKSFRIDDYQDELRAALQSEPTIVNGLLYRSYKAKEDFEEDTFLDLYIYQTAKKLGKITTGVEDYFTTEKTVLEAYADMAKEKKKASEGSNNSPYEIEKKVEDAYRRGDLDLLDSLEIILQGSEAFRNKFLLKRNEIQANSIDTILKKNSLFAAVGAAHLPGEKGVIELLRKMGYQLRPVKLLYKNALRQNEIDQKKVPVFFSKQVAADNLFSVEVPGNLYKLSSDYSGLDRRQYADMTNGAYYLVTRVQTYSAFNGSSEKAVYDKLDSLLYENIPGKIISKIPIRRNGYNGIDLTNKTRRGDIQRYQLFVTPHEVLIFKMGGKENYVNGPEAEKYFSSIQLRTLINGPVVFEPAVGGFKVSLPEMPHQSVNNSMADEIDRLEYEANDKANGNSYLILKKTVNNFNFLDEDSFDIKLPNESFKNSEFAKDKKQKIKKDVAIVPFLDVSQSLKDGGFARIKVILKGPHYYLLAAKGKDSTADFSKFFSSFQTTPFKYGKPGMFIDTFLHFTVMTPVVPELDQNFRALIDNISSSTFYGGGDKEPYWPKERIATFNSEQTGESISVRMQPFPLYFQMRDSANFLQNEINDYLGDNDMMLSSVDSSMLDQHTKAYRFTISDTNTSRVIYRMFIYNKSRLYRIAAMGDSSGIKSDFVKTFFSTFRPQPDSSNAEAPLNKKDQLFADIKSTDSATHLKAMIAFPNIYFSKDDIPALKSLIKNLKYSDKDYFDIKANAIRELGYITGKGSEGSVAKSLKEIYENTADTAIFQNAVIRALAKNKTKESYDLLKEFITTDPPLFENSYDYSSFFADIDDSLLLAKKLFPSMLHLLSIDDYKDEVMSLLVALVDSNLLSGKDYKDFYTSIYFDAKIALKKQQAKDENKMKIESKKNDANDDDNSEDDERYSRDYKLDEFATLLMPYYEKEKAVRKFFEKLLNSKDQIAQMTAVIALIKNNKTVPDSVLNCIASNDKFCASLYGELKEINRENRFPLAYKKQQLIARSVLVGNGVFNKIDSVEFVSCRAATYGNNRGNIYFYKYRVKKEDSWKIAFSGLQPSDLNDVDINNDYTKFTDKKLDYESPESDQFEKEFEKMVILSHKSGRNFFISNDYSRFADQ
ncbi:MAG TPA: TraB/GumN family protein [Hanamia sp.]|nr:TraB/GumN family protein [Hanamia sp.]